MPQPKGRNLNTKQYQVTSLDTNSLELSSFSALMAESYDAISAFVKTNKIDSVYNARLAKFEELLAGLQGWLAPIKSK